MKSKYVGAFSYIDKNFLVLSPTTDDISIASLATAIGAPVEITSTSLVFF